MKLFVTIIPSMKAPKMSKERADPTSAVFRQLDFDVITTTTAGAFSSV